MTDTAIRRKRARVTKRPPPPETVDRRSQALALRRLGHGYESIGRELGCSTKTAWNAVQQALHAIIEEPAKDVLKLELERLDLMLGKLLERVTKMGDPHAATSVVTLMNRRSRYLGLDVPEKRETEVAFQGPTFPPSMPPEQVKTILTMLLEHEADPTRRATMSALLGALKGLE